MYQPRRTLSLTARLNALVAKGESAAPEDIGRALDDTCIYLRDMLSDPEFEFALERLLRVRKHAPLTAADLQAFLAAEREVLIVFGMPRQDVEEALKQLRDIGQDDEPLPTKEQFTQAIARLAEVVCAEATSVNALQSSTTEGLKAVGHTLTGASVVSADVLCSVFWDGGLVSGLSVERGLAMTYRNARRAFEVFRNRK